MVNSVSQIVAWTVSWMKLFSFKFPNSQQFLESIPEVAWGVKKAGDWTPVPVTIFMHSNLVSLNPGDTVDSFAEVCGNYLGSL